MEEAVEALQQAVSACGCPREEGANLAAPLCKVDRCVGWPESSDACVLFIKYLPPPYCQHAVSFGDGHHFCACKQRLKVYADYRL